MTAGPAGHVALHVLHVERGLDRDPAGVERDRLADEAEHEAAARLGRVVAEDDQARRVVRPLRDRGERAHAERVRSRPGRALRRSGGRRLTATRERARPGARGELVRRRVREVARAVAQPATGPRGPSSATALADEHQPLEQPGGPVPGLPARGVVAAQQDPVDDRRAPARRPGGRGARPRARRSSRRAREVAGRRRRRRCERIGVDRLAARARSRPRSDGRR